VFAELARLFPGRFLHLGGDEVPTKQWEESPAAQARLSELRLESADDLHGWFISRLARTVKQLGRRPIGWNEVLDDELDPDVAIMSWTGQQPGVQAAREGRDVVMAPLDWTYFDHPATISPEAQAALDDLTGTPFLAAPFLTPIEQAYAFEPVPPELSPAESRRILGAQAQHWSESILDRDELDSRAFPRLSAFAEVVWSDASRRDYDSFRARFPEHVQRLDALGVRYSSAALP
jgi:hexosaminidase